MVDSPDSELVARSRAGSADAFPMLVQRHLAPLYDFVARLVLDGREASEVVRDTFVTARETLASLRDPERLRPWLYRLAYDLAGAHVRARAASSPAGPAREGGAATLDDETDRGVWATVTALELSTRAALDLHIRQGFTNEEIASVVGVEPTRADQYVVRVRAEVGGALAAVDAPLDAYAELGDVEVPDGLEEWVLTALRPAVRPREPQRRRRGGWRRAAVAAVVLTVTGLAASWAAENLAPRTAPAASAAGEVGDGAAHGPADASADAARGNQASSDGTAHDAGSAGGADDATGTDSAGDGDLAGDGARSDDELGNGRVGPDEEVGGPGAPIVRIVEPATGYVATAQDLGGGTWAANVRGVAEVTEPDGQTFTGRWYSDRQVQDLGRTGRTSFWLVLPDGCPGGSLVHTVTVEVTDSDGNVGVDAIDIEVRCP